MSEVYEQVIITCTTINVFIFIYGVISLAGLLISNFIRKRREKTHKQEDKEQKRRAAGIHSAALLWIEVNLSEEHQYRYRDIFRYRP